MRFLLGWLLATTTDDRCRDGQRALVLAVKVDEASGNQSAKVQDLFGAAYAALGRFPEAIACAQKAVEWARAARESPAPRQAKVSSPTPPSDADPSEFDVADPRYGEQLEARLRLYQAGKPFR